MNNTPRISFLDEDDEPAVMTTSILTDWEFHVLLSPDDFSGKDPNGILLLRFAEDAGVMNTRFFSEIAAKMARTTGRRGQAL